MNMERWKGGKVRERWKGGKVEKLCKCYNFGGMNTERWKGGKVGERWYVAAGGIGDLVLTRM